MREIGLKVLSKYNLRSLQEMPRNSDSYLRCGYWGLVTFVILYLPPILPEEGNCAQLRGYASNIHNRNNVLCVRSGRRQCGSDGPGGELSLVRRDFDTQHNTVVTRIKRVGMSPILSPSFNTARIKPPRHKFGIWILMDGMSGVRSSRS